MPHRNVIRKFTEDTTYHCYNRGVEQRIIFLDDQDYGVFLNRLKQLLTDPEILRLQEPEKEHLKSYYGDIELMTYCLMPNHFHLLLYQHSSEAIAEFMRSLSTSYTMYFNNRYQRKGTLFQGKYKARRVADDTYWQHISRYIHLNPVALGENIDAYPYSSLKFYKEVAMRPSWVKPDRVLELFGDYYKYRDFVRLYESPDFVAGQDSLYSLE